MLIFSLPRHQQLWDVATKCFRHVLGTNVGNALQSKGDVNWVPGDCKSCLESMELNLSQALPAGQVILDGLNNELDELRVARDQDRDEEVTLQSV